MSRHESFYSITKSKRLKSVLNFDRYEDGKRIILIACIPNISLNKYPVYILILRRILNENSFHNYTDNQINL